MQQKSNETKPLICLLIPYFGKWPKYLNLFLYTVAKQDNLKVMLFTDLEYQEELPNNVEKVYMTLDDFNQLASASLDDLTISITNPYKLCDLKPAYGLIFQDYIRDYSHWAFGDLDLIYGRVFDLLPANWKDYDVLSFREEWISGSFSVFKNSSYINNLFRRSKSYKECFISPDHQAFDECFKLYHLLIGKEPNYIFTCDSKESFTWVVRKEEMENNIKVYFKKLIKESIPSGDYVKYYDGKVEQKDGREYLYYHYITEKKTFIFDFPNWKKVPDQFYIDSSGFFTVDEFLSWKRIPITLWRILRGKLQFIYSLPRRIYSKYLRLRNG
jgi:hypothetical protein